MPIGTWAGGGAPVNRSLQNLIVVRTTDQSPQADFFRSVIVENALQAYGVNVWDNAQGYGVPVLVAPQTFRAFNLKPTKAISFQQTSPVFDPGPGVTVDASDTRTVPSTGSLS